MSKQVTDLQAAAVWEEDLKALEAKVLEKVEARMVAFAQAEARLAAVETCIQAAHVRADEMEDRLEVLKGGSLSPSRRNLTWNALRSMSALVVGAGQERLDSEHPRTPMGAQHVAELGREGTSMRGGSPKKTCSEPGPPASEHASLPEAGRGPLMTRLAELEEFLLDVRGRIDDVEVMTYATHRITPRGRSRSKPLSRDSTGKSTEFSVGVECEAPVSPHKSRTRSSDMDDLEHVNMSADTEYRFGQSVWDAAFFIGHPSLGAGGSMISACLLLFNIAAQMVFIGITFRMFTEETFTDDFIQGLTNWRINIGHNVKYFDKLTSSSLVQRICHTDGNVHPEMSDSKRDLVDDISTYLPAAGFMAIFSGPMLCTIAILCWSATVFRELGSVCSLIQGLHAVAKGPTTRMLRSETGELHVAALSVGRTIFIGFIIALRLAIAGLLFCCGIEFLINYSIKPVDILLNSVALEVVFNVDEAIFEALAPNAVRNLIHQLQPLPSRPVKWAWRGADLKSVLLLIALPTVLVAANLMVIFPMVARIREAQEAMCDGNQAFIYALDPFRMTYASPTNLFDLDEARGSSHANAILEQMYPETIPEMHFNGARGPRPLALGFPGQGVEAVAARAELDTQEASAALQDFAVETGACVDIFHLAHQFPRFLAQAEPQLSTAKNCADLRHLCGTSSVAREHQGIVPLIRAICPVTCGCADPFSDLFTSHPDQGCPASCEQSKEHLSAISSANCTEASPEELRPSGPWPKWAWQLGQRVAVINSAFGNGLGFMCEIGGGDCQATVLSLGCGIVDYWANRSMAMFGDAHDVCKGDWLPGALHMRPLATVCPVTCKCRERFASPDEGQARGCPEQCSLGLIA